MSEKEKQLIKNIAAMPPEMQNRFADMAAGAAMAIEMSPKGEDNKDERGS